MAYVLRVLKGKNRRSGPLQADEVRGGRLSLIKQAQWNFFHDEIQMLKANVPIEKNSKILRFNPFLDKDGVLCVGGRLSNARSLPYRARHPIILPKCLLAVRLATWIHKKQFHSSREATLNALRAEYWIIQGRSVVRRAIYDCLECRKKAAQVTLPRMANLPVFRVKPDNPPFAFTGVDFFGPIEVVFLRRRLKRWVCLFTCLASRAVHMEIAYGLDTDTFILAMNRFEARRGTPSNYFSDNGTNFVGAQAELHEQLNAEAIEEKLATREVKWNFNPPSAPHFGGAWERLIRPVKVALAAALSGQTLTDDVLHTSIVQIENLVNSRPLCYVSDDPENPTALTPNLLLTGSIQPTIVPSIDDQDDVTSRRRWKRAVALCNMFWRRWTKEYIPTLALRSKWRKDVANLAQGDIVIVKDSSNPRGTWPVGRILRVIPGADGVVRSAVVWVNKTELHRPVHKLALLESADK